MSKKSQSPTKQPLVSFLMPVYNGGEFLTETIHSILEQSYENFEVIAINDGSKDDSLATLQKFAKIDDRIRVIDRENRGLVATLNQAIELAKGEYLARIDADDLCVPHRIKWQVEAMEKNKNAALCYGFFEIFSEDGEFLGKEIRPTQQEDLKRMMYFRNPIAHASVMLRKSMLPKKWYSADVGPTEDYELWSRIAAEHDFVCVPKVIMRYRVTRTSIMHRIGHTQHEHMDRNTKNYWNYIGPPAVRKIPEIRERMSAYMKEFAETGNGPWMLSMMLDSESQLAMRCIRYGDKSRGIKIFLYTMLSSRTGMKVCFRRVRQILGNVTRNLLKRSS